uniref:UFO2 n=1 Tax=Pinus tabuliformis TaxID=88731 RepID=A0A0K0M755_PINTB|nr:UFO2 [Pinus tabuliformis]
MDPSLSQLVIRSYGSRESSSSSSSSSQGTWMDPRLWSMLPPKLVEKILACLPPPSFFRMRSVCKHWYRLLFSDSFLELCAEAAPQRQWFLLFKPGVWTEGYLYDPFSMSWFRTSLSSLPSIFSVVASAGGLLCCLSENPGCKTVLICNPLTKECLQLPCTLKERFVPSVGLIVEKETKAYKVIVAGDDMISPFAVKNLTTEMYDSVCQYWTIAGPLPRLCNLESGKMTHANGILYCMNYSPFSVLAYDLEPGMWSKIQAPMRRFLRSPNLVECRGRLVMVAAVQKSKLNVPKSVRIWGLQDSRTGWVELERMPQSLYDEFMKVCDQETFSCIAHGNIILISCSKSSDMLTYDMYHKLWSWVPRCPFVHATQGLQGFAFEPRLETSVC